MSKHCPQVESLVAAGLQSRILLPDDEKYTERVNSYWCNSAKLRPAAIVQPSSALEVSTAVKALAGAGQVFAIRAGGHTNFAGSNNIDGSGVTIDLGLLNATTYDAATQTAHVEPAAKWKNVYLELDKYGRVVIGAREAEVGVGGFLLGGGNTFYTARYGFACDNVLAFEVVLADGRVVTADATGEHADLFRVLKGGSNNFGIVTRFILRTIPSSPFWGGIVVHPKEVIPKSAKAIEEFAAVVNDPDSSLNFSIGRSPRYGGDAALAILTNVAGVESPAAFQSFLKMPQIMSNLKPTTINEVIHYAALPGDYYNIWYTLAFKTDASILAKAIELQTRLADEVQAQVPDGDFTTHVSFQPIARTVAQQSVAAGGNVLGLEDYPHDAILIQANASVRTKALADWARPRVRALIDGIRAFAETVDGGAGACPWIYLNYASPDQDVLRGYGPENVRRMREAAAKYDPDGVFQRLCPGGFKISAVRD